MSEDLDKLSKEELGKLFPIKLTDKEYDWQALFKKEKETIQKILGA